jgi:GTP-binding protein EngB required for normal cell division
VSDSKQRPGDPERPAEQGEPQTERKTERKTGSERGAAGPAGERGRGFGGVGETLGGVGETLGGFARRVGEFVGELPGQVAATVSPTSAALERTRVLRMAGALDAASEALRQLRVERPSDDGVVEGLRRVALLQAWLRGAPLPATAWQTPTNEGARTSEAPNRGTPMRLLEDAWRAIHDETRGEAGAREALDLTRRAARLHDGLAAADRDELRLLTHLVAADACAKLGAWSRGVRELAKAQGRLVVSTAATRSGDGSTNEATLAPNPLREAIAIRRGSWLLALDRVAEAELVWSRHLQESGTLGHDTASSDVERTRASERAAVLVSLRASRAAFTARLHAARGDAAAASLALRELEGETRLHGEATAVALCLGDTKAARREALLWLREAPTNPERMRAWALAELLAILDEDTREASRRGANPTRGASVGAVFPPNDGPPNTELPNDGLPNDELTSNRLPNNELEILRALVIACRRAPEGRRAAHRHELAFALLVLDAPVDVHTPAETTHTSDRSGAERDGRTGRDGRDEAHVSDALIAALGELDASRAARDRFAPGTAGSEGPRPAELELVTLRQTLAREGHAAATLREPSASAPRRGPTSAETPSSDPTSSLAQRLGFDLSQRPIGIPPSLEATTQLPERDGVGPDAMSPLRLPGVRARVLECHTHLVAAALAAAEGRHALADDLRVLALGVDPRSRSARVALERLPTSLEDRRIETRLTVATERLAEVPTSVAGVHVEGVEQARAGIVEARERLARPLTLAIMGEFSAGKSSVVNALLGESIAAVGALPTTATINLFRRGPTGTARVFHRDGTLAIVAPGQIEAFLTSLDDVAASRIRHVEIERGEERLGDLTIVDTPGLNALDAYHERVAREFLDTADAVIWVSSATRTITASELRVLDELRASGREVLAILNKIDVIDAHEQGELITYVREQLAGRVVDVVPVSAERALAWRRAKATSADPSSTASSHATGTDPKVGEDPFATLERALHTHFVARGRELKLALVERRLATALNGALAGLHTAIASLEADARRTLDDEALDHAMRTVDAFERALDGELVTLADPLTRELLAVGAAVSGVGLGPSADDAADLAYLDARLGELLESAFDKAITRAAIGGERVAIELLTRELGPWSRGYLAGLRHRGLLPELVRFAGPAALRGERELEAALTLRLRAATLPVLEATQRLRIPLTAEVRSARRRRASLPEAEALRLRARHVAALEALARLGSSTSS